MKIKHNKTFNKPGIILMLLITALLSACSGTPKVEWELSISGAVSNPTIFTYEELVDLPQIALNDILMEKSRGEDEIRSFSGIEIALLLEKTGAHDDFSSITAIAADGYAIEITPDEMTDGIVALKDGGDWIVNVEPEAGPIRLVFPGTPSNRWVFQVNEIIVNP